MVHRKRLVPLLILLIFVTSASAQQVNPALYHSLRWRSIGPFRGGRASAIAGVPSQPAVYYMGTPGGGVWKTIDAGRVWKPIFDEVKVASIGAVAVADSNPNIVYVGTGEQTQGNGVYRSNDAGATWTNVGLPKTHVITALLLDPKDPNIVLVGVAGDHQSGTERGVFKTTDGGKTWRKTLYKDEHTSIADMNLDPGAPQIVYAALWHRGQPGGGDDEQGGKGQDGFIFRSADEGSTWQQVAGTGLPTAKLGRVGVAVIPGTNGNSVFAIVNQGLFRSDNGGATWRRASSDPRVIGSGYFSRVFVDPSHPDVIYVAQTSMYRSKDGGKSFEAFYGAPSGDDIHLLWINPRNSQYALLGTDQGAIVSEDGGATWTSWYNQATGQFYHLAIDNAWPYTVYASQQDSGTAAVPSRSNYGEITYRDWAPAGGFEFSFIAPDPLNANAVYIGGWYGSVLRYDKVTGQIVHVFVRTPRYRTAGMAPIIFSPEDPHVMYVGAQFVMKTTDGGVSWKEISPDLTAGGGSELRNQVISTLAPSPLNPDVIWAGTLNGLVQVTRNAETWQNVTPPKLPEHSGINAIEASRFDPAEAYAVVNAREDFHPMVYRTRDYGKSWQSITNGLRENVLARVVREDPVRKGLLFAGTEDGAYVSFDDGDHWQPLQLNLPTTSVRDLTIHGDDLVAATYGRSLWILDDITPLRQIKPGAPDQDALFPPQKTIRTRWDMNQDTPLPPETPAGKNPPDGAILDYYLNAAASSDLKLAIYDSHNTLVREFTTTAPPFDTAPPNAPEYWFAAPEVLPTAPGHNRFTWDLRYPPPKTLRYGYYGHLLDYIEYTLADHAIPGETPRQQPVGPLADPGEYTVELTANGHSYRQPLTITLDPRVHVSQVDLEQQLRTERDITAMMALTYDSYQSLAQLRSRVGEGKKSLEDKKLKGDSLQGFSDELRDIADGTAASLGIGPINRELARLLVMIGSGDARPAGALQAGVMQQCEQLNTRLAQWRDANSAKLSAASSEMQAAGLEPLPAANVPADVRCR